MIVVQDDVTLRGRVDGPPDGPVVLFVNALGSDLSVWDDVVAELDGTYRCVRYDKRGHGGSTAAAPYDLVTQTGDLQAVLRRTEAHSAIVVGLSVGGLIAQRAALEHSDDPGSPGPELVGGLVLCDTAPRIGSVEGWNERIRWIERDGLASAASAIVERWFAPGFAERNPSALARCTDMLARSSQDGYVGTCKLLRDSDLTGRLDGIGCPTLVVTGSEDVATPPAQGRALAGALARSRFAEIAGAGHFPCVEKPRELAGLIADFAGGVRNG